MRDSNISSSSAAHLLFVFIAVIGGLRIFFRISAAAGDANTRKRKRYDIINNIIFGSGLAISMNDNIIRHLQDVVKFASPSNLAFLTRFELSESWRSFASEFSKQDIVSRN